MSEFKESKKLGDYVEELVLNRIQKKYFNAYIDDKGKKFSDWDIFIPEISEGIEVKSDYKSKLTGNVIIEVVMDGRLSALSVTKAKYWIITEGYRLIWITPLEIYKFLEINQYKRSYFVGNGDTVPKYAYKVNLVDLIKYVYGLDKKDGFVEMINENNELYYDKVINKFNIRYD
jgi:hypothetical protein